MSSRRDQLCKQTLINGGSDEVYYEGVRGVPFKDENARGIPFAARAKWRNHRLQCVTHFLGVSY